MVKMAWVAVLLLAAQPRESAILDRVHRIELNHMFSPDTGKYLFTQYIFWNFNESESRWDVVDWRMCRGCRLLTDEERIDWNRHHPRGPPKTLECGTYIPRRVWHREAVSYAVEWRDEKTGANWRRVEAPIWLQSWTVFDPEVEARSVLPPDKRRRLSRGTSR